MALVIKSLDLGDIEADRSQVVYGNSSGARVRVPTLGHLILGGDGPILVDTGYRETAFMDRLGMKGYRLPGQELKAQLAVHGLELADVRVIVHTHLHLDHCGQDYLFPHDTPVIVNRRELEYSVSGLQGELYAAEDTMELVERLHAVGALRLLDLDFTGPCSVAQDVLCAAAGGHTEGSMVIYVETGAGVACICGDLIYSIQDQVVEPVLQTLASEPAPVDNSPLSRRQEISAIKKVLNSCDYLLPMHDRPARVRGGSIVGRIEGAVPGDA